jgi:hypothetical protein
MPEPQIEQTYWNDFEDKISGQKFLNPLIVDIQLNFGVWTVTTTNAEKTQNTAF